MTGLYVIGVQRLKIFENMTIIRITKNVLNHLWRVRMKIASIMTRNVYTVDIDDSLKTIRDIFGFDAFHHILVEDGRRLVGVISDRDLLRALSPFLGTLSEKKCDKSTLDMKAHQIMSKEIVTVNAESSIEDAISQLLEWNIYCLPVLSPLGVVEGIVTWKDILRFYSKTKTVTV